MLRLLENADPENGKLDADWSKLLLLRKMEATNDSDRRLLIDITSFAGLHVGEPPFGSRDISHEITKLDIGSFFNLWGWGLEESLECRKMTDEKELFLSVLSTFLKKKIQIGILWSSLLHSKTNYRVQAKSFDIRDWTFGLEFKSQRGPKTPRSDAE